MWEEGDKSAIKKLDWKMKSMKFNVSQRQTSETFSNLELTQPSSINLITMGNKKMFPCWQKFKICIASKTIYPNNLKLRSKTP